MIFIKHTRKRARTETGGGGTLLGTLGRRAQTVLRPGFDHIFASAAALRPITVNKNPCLHVVNLIIFSLYIFRFSTALLYIYDILLLL